MSTSAGAPPDDEPLPAALALPVLSSPCEVVLSAALPVEVVVPVDWAEPEGP
ncbi:MAG: hypothetical protein KUG77_08705 [Nannocystaceae bacterium]|nr:hypothetical protein [Nannocystaceae bacterium]